MQKLIKKLLTDKVRLLLAAIITIIIAVLSLIKLGKLVPVNISFLDKIQHAIAYFTLTLFWLFALYKRLKISVILLICLLYGIIIEGLQSVLTIYRVAELYDILANTTGIVLAYVFFELFLKKSWLFKK